MMVPWSYLNWPSREVRLAFDSRDTYRYTYVVFHTKIKSHSTVASRKRERDSWFICVTYPAKRNHGEFVCSCVSGIGSSVWFFEVRQNNITFAATNAPLLWHLLNRLTHGEEMSLAIFAPRLLKNTKTTGAISGIELPGGSSSSINAQFQASFKQSNWKTHNSY